MEDEFFFFWGKMKFLKSLKRTPEHPVITQEAFHFLAGVHSKGVHWGAEVAKLFLCRIQSYLLDVILLSAFLILTHLCQQDCYLRKQKSCLGCCKSELKFQLSQVFIWVQFVCPLHHDSKSGQHMEWSDIPSIIHGSLGFDCWSE